MKKRIAVNVEYEEVNTSDGNSSLSPEERELVIQWADDIDRDKIFIYSSYQPMIRKLLKNPLFECQRKSYNRSYKVYPKPVSVEGTLPFRALTLRSKFAKKRKLTEKQKKLFRQRMKHARKSRFS